MTLDLNNRTNLDILRKDIRDALAPVLERHGIALEASIPCTYQENGDSAKYTIRFCAIRNGEVIEKIATDFRAMALLYGLQPDDLGKVFKTWDGAQYKITGLKPSSRKYPILAQKVGTNKTYKFNATQITTFLKTV
jgi:hypothetical protein